MVPESYELIRYREMLAESESEGETIRVLREEG